MVQSAAFKGSPRRGPAADADEISTAQLPDDESIIGGLFGIEYRDSKSEISTRDIIVRSVVWKSSKLQVGAHCLLRDTYRCFVAQNIVTLAHGRTGEIIADPVAFFGTLALPRAESVAPRGNEKFAEPKPLNVAAMRRELRDLIRPAAVLLMAMARADDAITPEEVGVIADLVWQGARKTYTIAETDMLADMVTEMTALQPSGNLITRALNLTLDRGAFPDDLPKWLSRMARADGHVVPEENAAYVQILATLRRLISERN